MASGGRWKRDRKNSEEDSGPGLGSLFAAAAVGAGLAALGFGAKKLYEYVTDENKKEKQMEDSYSPPSRQPDPRPESMQKRDVPKPPPAVPAVNLAERLEEYYQGYVCIPEEDTARAQAVLTDIKDQLLKYFQASDPDFNISMLSTVGSGADDTQVVTAREFDVMVVLGLEQNRWSLVRDEQGTSPLHYALKRTNIAEKPVDTDKGFDGYVDDNLCLAPMMIMGDFADKLDNFVMQVKNYPLELASREPAICLEVAYDDGRRLTINFLLTVCLNGILASALPTQNIRGYLNSSSHSNFWHMTTFDNETRKLQIFNKSQCCHLAVLRIIKAIRLNFPAQFGLCGSYVYKTVLLHMLRDVPEEDFWHEQCLQEQFIDFLDQLVGYLQQRRLPHFFCDEVNLLAEMSPATCDSFVSFILKRIGKEKLHTLLVTDYYQPK